MFRGRGRGNGAGRGRGAHPSAQRTSAVPAFPVVSRGAPAAAQEESPAATSAPRRSSLKGATADHHHQHHHSGEDDDAPPVAVSARRSGGAAAAAEEEGHAGFVPPSSARGGGGEDRGRGHDRGLSRGRGSFRGGRGDGGFRVGRGGAVGRGADRNFRGGRGGAYAQQRGRGGFARGGGAPRHDDDGNAEEDAREEKKSDGPTRVITTVTDSGTELPRKLNTKVFLDGLPYTYTPEPGKPTLEEEVLQFAAAWKVGKPLRLIKKPGQGFGFLVLQSPNSVATAVRVLNGRKFLGRALRVEEPKPKDLEKMKDIGGMKDMGKDSFTRQVLLTDLAKVAQPEIIREVLRDVAPQLEKKLEAIKMTSQNRKAFLTFESETDVAPAITFLDGFHLLGRRISAAQAAAPGSLPFSHGGTGPSRGGLAAAAAAAGGASASKNPAAVASHEVDEEEELTVVPLGMAPVKSSAAPSPSTPSSAAVRRRENAVQATAASASGAGSNVTGRTEKYNLLDDGPKDIYVGNVGEDVTESQLRQHFTPCGAIRKCEILVHPETHLSTGIAHIEFAVPAYAAYALDRYHGSRLRGCVLRVDRGDAASVPLAAELPPAEAEDDYDEDAFMERYGVKDKKTFFRGTSVAAEMGAAPDFEEEEEEAEEDDTAVAANKRGKKKKKVKRERAAEEKNKRTAAASAPAEKRARAEPLAGRKAKGKAAEVAEEDEDDDITLITSHAMEDNDDDDEEHFYDADTVPVAATRSGTGAPSGKKAKKNAKAKAGKSRR